MVTHLTKDTHSAKTSLHERLRLLFALVFSKLCFLHCSIGRLEMRLLWTVNFELHHAHDIIIIRYSFFCTACSGTF